MTDKNITLHPYLKNVAYYSYDGQQQPIFYYPDGIYTNALSSCFNQIKKMLSHHNKVTIVWFQLHQAVNLSSNEHISLFIQKFKALCKQHYAFKRVGFSWAREEGKSGDNLHYHVAIMVDGSKCRSGYYLIELAKQAWLSINPMYTLFAPQRNTFRLKRDGDMHSLLRARMRLSYAAKKATKESIPNGVRKFGFSSL